jgi:trimethylamine--corrinoid protein Co-methyltransferase
VQGERVHIPRGLARTWRSVRRASTPSTRSPARSVILGGHLRDSDTPYMGSVTAPERAASTPARAPSARRSRRTCYTSWRLSSAGWLEGGLAPGYEKFVMDVDQAGMFQTMLAGVDLSEDGQAMDAIREVGSGKHFLGCAHTPANFGTAFGPSVLADNNSDGQRDAEGRQDMAMRGNALWKKLLRDDEMPPIDPAVDEALLDDVNRSKASFAKSNV